MATALNGSALVKHSIEMQWRCVAKTGIVLISNGKVRCRGAKKGHGRALKLVDLQRQGNGCTATSSNGKAMAGIAVAMLRIELQWPRYE